MLKARTGPRVQVQNRYQVHNPDAARPARRIYVGGLPPDTVDVRAGTGAKLCGSDRQAKLALPFVAGL